MNSKAVFTILSRNYLGQALALKDSFLRFHDDVDFYIVLMDRRSAEADESLGELDVVWAEDLPIENYWRHAFKFDVIEWSTNVKPFAAKWLLEQYEKVLYLDPDLYFYRNIDWIFSALSDHSAVVTPHATTPIYDEHPQGDLEWMRVGTFNLGFIGLRKCSETDRLLAWWGERCLTDGYLETASGVFVDQKWITLAMGFFPGIKILYHKGINIATWNFHERKLGTGLPVPVLDDGTEIYFFHFSGFDFDEPSQFSKRQSRWPAGSLPELEPLAEDYKRELVKHNFKSRINQSYSNDFFSDSVYVTPLVRRVYALLFSGFNDDDPFKAGSDIYSYGIKHGLVGKGVVPEKRLVAKDIAKYGFQVKMIDFALRVALKLVGPGRYFSLMRYLAYISSIRQQDGVFKRNA